MTLMRSKSMNSGSVSRIDFQERVQVGVLLLSTVLPQTRAGLARWSESRLCPIPTGASNQMNADQFDRNVESAFALEDANGREDTAARSVARSKIGEGARAVNRLVWSLWVLLLPLFWPSSDWVGLIILSQAFFVAAKLIQPAISKTGSADSSVNAVIGMERGEDCAQG
jgi:hypothetical protein